MDWFLAVAGWTAAGVFFCLWVEQRRVAAGWRALFEAHFVNPNLKSH